MAVINTYQKRPHFLTPTEAVKCLGLEAGETVLDYGSGAGFWTIPLAKIVGSKGRVVAVDANEIRLQIVTRLAQAAGLSNIKIASDESLEAPVPTKERFDFILVSNVLSEICKHQELLSELAENAEIGTRLAVVEWSPVSPIGPLATNRLTEDKVVLMAAKAGFKFSHTVDVGTFHYGLMFRYNGEKFHGPKK